MRRSYKFYVREEAPGLSGESAPGVGGEPFALARSNQVSERKPSTIAATGPHGERPHEVLLVVGFDATGPARLPRLLSEAGCRGSLLPPPGCAVNRSGFVDRRYEAPTQQTVAEAPRHPLAGRA